MVKNISYSVILCCFFFSSSVIGASVNAKNAFKQSKPLVLKDAQNKTTPETGKDIYLKYCLSCHQKDGGGVPNTFPSLQKSDWVNGDKTRLIKVILNGLEGDIDVDGETYSGIMPKQDHLTDKQIALVLTYLRQNFGNKASAVNPKEVKILRGK